MNKGTHFNGQPMYGQLINLLDKEEILKFSRKYHGERYVKHFDAYQHLTVMLYAVNLLNRVCLIRGGLLFERISPKSKFTGLRVGCFCHFEF